MQKIRRNLGVGLAMVLVVAACGGGGTSESQPPATTAAAGTPESSNPGQDTTPTETGGGTDGDVSMAEVTIDGVTYSFGDFGPGNQCAPDQYGGFFATLREEDGPGVFGVELWQEGEGGDRVNKANALITVDGVKMDLTANPDQEEYWPAVEAGTSMVQSFQVNGNTATGVAAFIDDEIAYDESLFPLDPIIGEFTVVCATDG
jgi:hypothetical protein